MDLVAEKPLTENNSERIWNHARRIVEDVKLASLQENVPKRR